MGEAKFFFARERDRDRIPVEGTTGSLSQVVIINMRTNESSFLSISLRVNRTHIRIQSKDRRRLGRPV